MQPKILLQISHHFMFLLTKVLKTQLCVPKIEPFLFKNLVLGVCRLPCKTWAEILQIFIPLKSHHCRTGDYFRRGLGPISATMSQNLKKMMSLVSFVSNHRSKNDLLLVSPPNDAENHLCCDHRLLFCLLKWNFWQSGQRFYGCLPEILVKTATHAPRVSLCI